jgi:hypothetical protein
MDLECLVLDLFRLGTHLSLRLLQLRGFGVNHHAEYGSRGRCNRGYGSGDPSQ